MAEAFEIVEGTKSGDLIKVPHLDISNVAIADWVAGTNFRVVDAALGMIEIVAVPVAAVFPAAGTYNASEITA